jgi:hypothetical protein
MCHRRRVLERFRLDGEIQVTAVLHDLTESGLVFCSGSGPNAVYRAATDEELGRLSQLTSESGLDELVLAIIYRSGPLSEDALVEELGRPLPSLPAVLGRLVEAGRLQRLADARYLAVDLVIPMGSPVGWEAAVFDHLQAMVQTICQRLRAVSLGPSDGDVVGGSTYSYDVWPGHPLEAEVRGQLQALRQACHALSERVLSHNKALGLKNKHDQVITYVGQCVLERDLDDATAEEGVSGDA